MSFAIYTYKRVLEDYLKDDCVGRESKTEAYIRSHIISRIASPIVALSETSIGLVDLSLGIVAHTIGGFITLNGKQLVVAAKRGIVIVVIAIALPLIGLVGMAYPESAISLANELTRWTSRTLSFTPHYSDNQRRVILLVVAATTVIQTIANFAVDTITEAVLNTIKAVGRVSAKTINGVRGAWTLSPEILKEFNLP